MINVLIIPASFCSVLSDFCDLRDEFELASEVVLDYEERILVSRLESSVYSKCRIRAVNAVVRIRCLLAPSVDVLHHKPYLDGCAW